MTMISSSEIHNIVAVFGVPRSGTSWLGQIFNSSESTLYRYQPLFSYEFKDRIDVESGPKAINSFYIDLINAKSDFVLQNKTISGKTGPVFKKINPNILVWKEVRYIGLVKNILKNTNTKFVFLIRHPCAVINSQLNAPKELEDKNDWRFAAKKNTHHPENFYGYEKWKEAVEMFLACQSMFPDRVFLLKYEDLKKDSQKSTEKLFIFTGITLGKQTINFLKESTSRDDKDPYGVSRIHSKREKWKEELDPTIKNAILKDLKTFEPAKELGYIK